MKRAILQVVIEYDEAKTTAEKVAKALDRLTKSSIAPPGIMKECWNVDVGEFLIKQDNAQTYPV